MYGHQGAWSQVTRNPINIITEKDWVFVHSNVTQCSCIVNPDIDHDVPRGLFFFFRQSRSISGGGGTGGSIKLCSLSASRFIFTFLRAELYLTV